MDANEKIIHGTYTTSDETVQAVRRLNEEGYTKDQIRVYSSNGELKSSNSAEESSFDATNVNHKNKDGDLDISSEESRERSDDDSFDATNVKPIDNEGDFDITDEDSRERSEEGSFDRVDRGQDVNNAKPDDSRASSNDDDNDSVWESVKDFFTPDTYDYEKESQNPDYNPDQDILYPYREDLSRGHHVVVLNNQNMDGPPGGI